MKAIHNDTSVTHEESTVVKDQGNSNNESNSQRITMIPALKQGCQRPR